jgi:hypothetical protein
MKGKNFKQSMLGYCKTILEKMSFSKKLFLKEYRKSLTYLSVDEQNELRKWVRVNRVNENSSGSRNNQEEIRLQQS